MASKIDIKGLFYITHVDNVLSMLQLGILSHGAMEERHVPFTPIYASNIVSNRKDKSTPDHKSLWNYANVYFQPRNPMMYRVIHEQSKHDLVILGIKSKILHSAHVIVSDGNAANNPTQFFNAADGIKIIEAQWKIIQSEWWNDLDGSKRKIMAECLVPEKIPPEYIDTIFVPDYETKRRIEALISTSIIPVIAEPNFFFKPSFAARIGKNISLIEGDMFFSGMQTLTVSVNLQGIMGKGLASRAKYQFPDVYVYYQDACRSKKITATKPCIYKREASLEDDLADQVSPLHIPNSVKWFMLFATKRKWRENSRIDDIEGGLQWFRDHFAIMGIKSIALPALGCGLGGLNWAAVGPLMCSYLHNIGIDVAIYLPREQAIDHKLLSEEFLLKANL